MPKPRMKIIRKKNIKPRIYRKKYCRLCRERIEDVDYKDVNRLQRFISDRGKIIATRISGNCAKHQRKVASAIKRARFMALLPFLAD